MFTFDQQAPSYRGTSEQASAGLGCNRVKQPLGVASSNASRCCTTKTTLLPPPSPPWHAAAGQPDEHL